MPSFSSNTSSQKQNLLNQLLGEHKRYNNEFLFECPFCSSQKKKLSINIEKNVWKCWKCNKKGKSIGQLFLFQKNTALYEKWNSIFESNEELLNEFVEGSKKIEIVEKQIELPADFTSFSAKKGAKYEQAREYLLERGLNDYEILFFKLGFCERGDYFNRIIIPSFNHRGELNFFISRSFDKNCYVKYKNPPFNKDIIFNELLINFDKPLVVTEGFFDGIKFENSICLLGSSLNKKSNIFKFLVSYPQKIYFALDPDAYEKEIKIMKNLLAFDKEVYKVDITGYKDVGEMPDEIVKERFAKADLINEDFLLELGLKMVVG